MAVEPDSLRRKLQRAAVRNRWKFVDLDRAIREQRATTDYKDRPVKLKEGNVYVRGKGLRAVESLEALRDQIKYDADRWRRILLCLKHQAETEPNDRPGRTRKNLSTKDLDQRVLHSLEALVDSLESLEKRITPRRKVKRST